MLAAAITVVLSLSALALVYAALRLRGCRHRFGMPMSGYVCCLRCTRRFPIEQTAEGEWRIGKIALAQELPSYPPRD